MILQSIKRLVRDPLASLSLLLLAAVLSASLCGLQAASRNQQANYEEMRHSIPVKLIVSNLSGTQYDGLDVPNTFYKALTSRAVKNPLREYVTDVQAKVTISMSYLSQGPDCLRSGALVGLSGLDVSTELSQNPGAITWLEGWGPADLAGENDMCLIPEAMVPDLVPGGVLTESVSVSITLSRPNFGGSPENGTYTMVIVGTHSLANSNVYCSLDFARGPVSLLGDLAGYDTIQATLADNSRMEEFRQASLAWFAEPNPTGEKTPWKYSYYWYYPYALILDDSLLVSAERTLRISLLVNELCAWLIFALSAGASFFVGYLTIRTRKRELNLMRTLGQAPGVIFWTMLLEQMLWVVLGTALGGAAFGYEPAAQLLAFLGIYLAGLTLSLGSFLYQNLMTSLK